MTAKRRTAWAVMVAVLAAGVTVSAQTSGIFRRISTELGTTGYSRVGAPFKGWLDSGESTIFTTWLSSGEEYAIAGACDRDCSDVDLELFSPSGIELSRDLASDDEPMVFTTPTRSGRYQVRVTMARCSREPCEYVAGVFKR